MNVVSRLRRQMETMPSDVIESAGMQRIVRYLPGDELAFFPVGNGYFGASFPIGGVMFVGSEFGTIKNVDDVVGVRGERITDPTWRSILRLIDEGGIDREQCWFTNFALCARPGSGSNSNTPSPWAGHAPFIDASGRLFLEQVEAMRPRAIVLFGSPVARALAHLFPAVFGGWRHSSFRMRDVDDGALVRDAPLGSVDVPVVVSIVHPSKRHLNVGGRMYAGSSGVIAESRLMQEVERAGRVR